jgi:tRNA modification GTPase
MEPGSTDTIFALSSGHPPAGVAVVRLSGPAVRPTLEDMVGHVPDPRHMHLTSIRARSGAIIDKGLVVFFPGPNSFTGEDCAELHLHGSRAVLAALSLDLSMRAGMRAAEPGEFTQRAFINGKMDLTAAEALADLIDAETEAQRRFAMENASGRNAALYAIWRERIVHARAMIEAELDFADEGDVPVSTSNQIWTAMRDLANDIDRHRRAFHRSEIVREGFRVAIIGPPNAGKSSLINALARRDVAIVSDEPGTTRDLIEIALDLDGLKVILTDTAGLRAVAGAVEREGIARAVAAAERADLVLLVADVAADDEALPPETKFKETLRIGAKIDLTVDLASRSHRYDLTLSSRTGEGLDLLLGIVSQRASEAAGPSTTLAPFRARHVAELDRAHQCLLAFQSMQDAPLELAAEELRLAAGHLGRIIGLVDVEDILDVVFSRFCIGK